MITAADEFAQRLRNKLVEAVAEADRQLVENYADSFENYRYRTGYRKALFQCVDVILPDVIKEMGS